MSDALQAAFAARDISQVIDIYTKAADAQEVGGDVDAACFLLTHAWVHALEVGDDRANNLRARLVAHGREKDA
jgi:hypothetical protein